MKTENSAMPTTIIVSIGIGMLFGFGLAMLGLILLPIFMSLMTTTNYNSIWTIVNFSGWLLIGFIAGRWRRKEYAGLLAGASAGLIYTIGSILIPVLHVPGGLGNTLLYIGESVRGLLPLFISQGLLTTGTAAGIGLLGGLLGYRTRQRREPHFQQHAATRPLFQSTQRFYPKAISYTLIACIVTICLHLLITFPLEILLLQRTYHATYNAHGSYVSVSMFAIICFHLCATPLVITGSYIVTRLATRNVSYYGSGNKPTLWIGLFISLINVIIAVIFFTTEILTLYPQGLPLVAEQSGTGLKAMYFLSLGLFTVIWIVSAIVAGKQAVAASKRTASSQPKQDKQQPSITEVEMEPEIPGMKQ